MNRALTRVALILWVLLGSPLRAGAEPRRLVSVSVREGGGTHWLSITADRPPNFTSFKLSHPTRVVVDFPETTAVAGREVGPDQGIIAGWTVQSLGSANQVVARLTVELRKDADYTLTSSGNAVELRLISLMARPLVALENEHVPSARAEPAAPHEAVVSAPALVTVTTPSTSPSGVTAPLVTEAPTPAPTAIRPPEPTPAEMARLAKEARLAAAADKQRAEAEARTRALNAAKAKRAEQLAQAAAKKAQAAEAKRRQLAAIASAAAARREKAAEAKRAQVAAVRAKAERLAALKQEKLDRAVALKRDRALALKAQHEKSVEAAQAKAAASEAERARLSEARRAEASAAEEAAEEARVARMAEAKAQKEKPVEAGRVATFGQMGFRKVSSQAEVILHTSAPVAYSMREAPDGKLTLTLEHTRILVANNKLALDTSYFGTAVARVVPHDNARESRVEVEFDLSSPAPYEIKADGSSLTVLFSAPPVVRAEADHLPGMTAEP